MQWKLQELLQNYNSGNTIPQCVLQMTKKIQRKEGIIFSKNIKVTCLVYFDRSGNQMNYMKYDILMEDNKIKRQKTLEANKVLMIKQIIYTNTSTLYFFFAALF